MPTRKTRRRSAASAALGLALAAGVAGLGPSGVSASSHREAPLIAADPAVDNTDVYGFVSPDRPGYVTFVANFIPFEEPNGGPNFYPFATYAVYNIKIDNNGDARPDVVYRWKFHNIDKRGGSTFLYNNGPVTSIADKNLLFRQTYTLQASFNGGPFQTRVANAPVAPSRVGPASMPDYGKLRSQAVTSLPGGWKTFAGQADDPFFLDLRVFDLLYGGNLKEVGQDTLAGYNVNTIAIQVPFRDVALNANAKRNPVVGIWSTAERPKVRIAGKTTTSARNWVQVSRLGNPLVNEVVVPASLKDAFNALPPVKDASIAPVVARVKNPEVPKLIQGIYGIKAPATPRNDLVEIFLTGITTKAGGPIKADLNSQLNNADVNPSAFRPSEMLRLNLSVKPTAKPNRLGVLGGDLQGFPNGRRLTDDVVDGMIVAASTTLLAGSRAGERGGKLPWALLVVGSAASLAANVAVAQPTAAGRVIAAWPSFALIGAYELLMRQVRHGAAGGGRTRRERRPRQLSTQETNDRVTPRPRRHSSGTGRRGEGPGAGGSAGRQLQRQAWHWALAHRTGDGSLPSGSQIARQCGRHERWGRLVKRAGAAGELDDSSEPTEPGLRLVAPQRPSATGE